MRYLEEFVEKLEEEFPSISQKDILKLEATIKSKIPDDYKEFLLQHNGGRPQKYYFSFKLNSKVTKGYLDWFLGIHKKMNENIYQYIKMYKNRIPSDLIPIGHDPGGNLICLKIKGDNVGSIYFWDHENEVEEGEKPNYNNLSLVSKSFSEFLTKLF